MSVYVLYESVYIYMNNCCICFHVWMAPGKISFKLTGSPSLNKVFELNCRASGYIRLVLYKDIDIGYITLKTRLCVILNLEQNMHL